MLSALKNFGVTFLISALLFGIIAYFATRFVSNTVNDILDDDHGSLDEIEETEPEPGNPSETEAPPVSGPEEPLIEGESFNFLLVTTDYRPDLYSDYAPSAEVIAEKTADLETAIPTLGIFSVDFREVKATSIVLVRVDRDRRQFVYTYFTPEMLVYTPSGYRSLSEITTLYGTQSLTEYVNAMTGMKIHYTLLLHGYQFDRLAELMGPVTVNLPRDIYQNGEEITMNYQHTVQHIGTDGWPWTEEIPNTWLMGVGDNVIDGDKLFTLSLADESTEADRDAKASYSLSIVKTYLTALASLDESDARRIVEQLITPESGWRGIPGYVAPEPEFPEPAEPSAPSEGEASDPPDEPEPLETEAPETEIVIDPDLPFDPTPIGGAGSSEASGPKEEETEEEDRTPVWIQTVGEPDSPALDTNYTMEDYEATRKLLGAVTSFTTVNVTYPCTYTAAAENRASSYEVRLKDGLELFGQWRAPVESANP